MMIDAASTWGLVIGIDTYDSPDVPDLAGAARDAASAVTWLRALGVPKEQILLHAAPSDAARPEIDALALPAAGCRDAEIWSSFETLMGQHGSRLFVFLAGHGLWEPAGARVFLTQDSSSRVMRNLGIDWYARLLRGLPFSKQFIIMDGCLNLPYSATNRARFRAGEQGAVQPDPERADVDQWFCYGAAVGQRSIEDDGHGLFSRALLKALDPALRDPRCLVINDETGATVLDLHKAMSDIVEPEVSGLAWKKFTRRQNPGVQMLSGGAARTTVPVVEFAPVSTSSISIVIDPPEALPEISRVTLSFDDIDWRRRVPSPPDVSVPKTFLSVLPPGLRMQVRCSMIRGSAWRQPAQQEIDTDQDRKVHFLVEPHHEAAAALTTAGDPAFGELPDGKSVPRTEINTVSTVGGIVGAMEPPHYDQVRAIIDRSGPGIVVEPHETGPVLYAIDGDVTKLNGVTVDIVSRLSHILPTGLGARASGVDTTGMTATVSVALSEADALRLGGLLQASPVVRVGDDTTLSLSDLVANPHVSVDPGLVTVSVTLPWGTWTKQVRVDQHRSRVVKPPPSVGIPPLRVALLKSARPSDAGPPDSIVPLGTRAAPRLVTSGSPIPFARSTSSPWKHQLWSAPAHRVDGRTDLGELRSGPRALRFPLNPYSSLAVQVGDRPRAEPLSIVESTAWDRLVASGRLEDITPPEAVNLTQSKWFDRLLGLAGAYACFAQQQDDYARIVLRNLDRLDEGLADVTILSAALDRRAGSRKETVRRGLARVLADGAVPLFGWGVAIGALAARHYRLADLAERYEEISDSLISDSTWTLWEHRG